MHRARKNSDRIIRAVARHQELLSALGKVTTEDRQREFADAVLTVLGWNISGQEYAHFQNQFFNEFCSWTSWDKCGIPNAIIFQHMQREIARSRRRREKRDFLKEIGIAGKVEPGSLNPVFAEPLTACYPPLGTYVAESQEEADIWNTYLLSSNPPDKRVPRRPATLLDPSRLQRTVGRDESCAIYEKGTGKLIACAIHNFCPRPGVTAWVADVIKRATNLKTNIRKEDQGKLVLMGYSAGSRSKPCFGWAKNLRSQNHADGGLRDLDYETSSVFTLFWNMCKRRLPAEVIDDIEDYLDETGIRRMDANGLMASEQDLSKGDFVVSAGDGVQFRICEADLAPPMGVFGANYSRAIHYESQPHKYSISWTVARNMGPSMGGNFFLSRWGIRILQAPDTVIVWMPESPHGTSLQRLDPHDKHPEFLQTGLAIVTSPRLTKLWSKWEDGEVGCEAALKGHAVIESDGVKYSI